MDLLVHVHVKHHVRPHDTDHSPEKNQVYGVWFGPCWYKENEHSHDKGQADGKTDWVDHGGRSLKSTKVLSESSRYSDIVDKLL